MPTAPTNPRTRFDLRPLLRTIGLVFAASGFGFGIWLIWDGASYLLHPAHTGFERMFAAIVALLRTAGGILLTAFSVFIGLVIPYDWHLARSRTTTSKTSETSQ